MRRFSSSIFLLHFHQQQLQIVIHIDVILNLSIYLSEYLVCSFIHFIHSSNGNKSMAEEQRIIIIINIIIGSSIGMLAFTSAQSQSVSQSAR